MRLYLLLFVKLILLSSSSLLSLSVSLVFINFDRFVLGILLLPGNFQIATDIKFERL